MLVQIEHALERIADGSYGAVRDLRQPDRQEPADGVPAGDPVPELQAARGASLIASEASGRPTGRRRPAPADQPPALPAGPGLRGRGVALRSSTWSASMLAVRELTGRRAGAGGRRRCCELRLLRNPGAAFSAGSVADPRDLRGGRRRPRAWSSVYAARVRHRGWAVALGLLLAGVMGNLVDRLFRAPGPVPRATWSTSSRCRTGRCSTSPTCASTWPGRSSWSCCCAASGSTAPRHAAQRGDPARSR